MEPGKKTPNEIDDFLFCFVFLFRDVFMEKHWKTVISKSICDYFFEAQSKVNKQLIDFPLFETIKCIFRVQIRKMYRQLLQRLIIF
mgnify:FL=1